VTIRRRRAERSGGAPRRAAVAMALLACLAGAPAVVGHEAAPLPPLEFDPPRPGTYRLYRIMRAPDGEVLGLDGRAQRLSHFTHGRITLLGFIYTTCTDPEGCPLAYRVFETVRQALASAAEERPGFAGARRASGGHGGPAAKPPIQLVTLSFDPLRDTPAAMRQYGGSRVSANGHGPRWYFLTTRSARELAPLVEGFGQDVRHTIDRSNGRPRRELSHVLKVFLIDPAGFVREIYTSTFLHPQTVLNDVETLLMEHPATSAPSR
jgi:cytochrome oxidase Cu insertion factor (SCO1/SenC/PrrC family)